MKRKLLTIVRYGLLLACAMCLASCATSLNRSIDAHLSAAKQIQVGDSKERVLSILEPTRCKQKSTCYKTPDIYRDEKNRLVEIYFYRCLWSGDSTITDDEWTPYMFVEGKLVSIGWTALGGPKSTSHGSQTPAVIPITTPVIIRH